jgi:hypothetical protein
MPLNGLDLLGDAKLFWVSDIDKTAYHGMHFLRCQHDGAPTLRISLSAPHLPGFARENSEHD